MSKKVIQFVRRTPPFLAAVFVMALFGVILFLVGPRPTRAQQASAEPKAKKCCTNDALTSGMAGCPQMNAGAEQMHVFVRNACRRTGLSRAKNYFFILTGPALPAFSWRIA